MNVKSIPFNAAMVRALLEGRKTQTRRIVNLDRYYTHLLGYNSTGLLKQYENGKLGLEFVNAARGLYSRENPDGLSAKYVPISFFVGDRLCVREAFSGFDFLRNHPPRDWPLSPIWYWADGNPSDKDWTRPKPSIHMPRWASRLTLLVTDVRVQRLQDISEEDAIAEGVNLARADGRLDPTSRLAFSNLWDSIHGPGAWDANPWVSAVTFTVHHCNIDQMVPA